MKPEKLEQNHERLQLKEQARKQKEQNRIDELVAKYADVSSSALVTRKEEAYAKVSTSLSVFTVSFAACLLSITTLALGGLLAPLPSMLSTAFKIVAAISAPIAAIAWIASAKLYKEVEQLRDVIEWRIKSRHEKACGTETFDLPEYEPIWGYSTPEEYLAAKAVEENAAK